MALVATGSSSSPAAPPSPSEPLTNGRPDRRVHEVPKPPPVSARCKPCADGIPVKVENNFCRFVCTLSRAVCKVRSPMSTSIRRFLLHPGCTSPSLRGGDRPFPCPRPRSLESPDVPRSGRRRDRFNLGKSVRTLCNLYAGAMGFYALGRPKHIPSDAVPGLRSALHATAESALTRYEEGIRVMLREPRCFSGVSGGRAAIAAQLADLAVPQGSSRARGPKPGLRYPVLSPSPQSTLQPMGSCYRKLRRRRTSGQGMATFPLDPRDSACRNRVCSSHFQSGYRQNGNGC